MLAFTAVVGVANISAGGFLTSIFRITGWIKVEERMVRLCNPLGARAEDRSSLTPLCDVTLHFS